MLPDYLCDCSLPTLQGYMLSRLERAEMLRREMLNVLEQYVEAAAEAEATALLVNVRRAVPKKPAQRRLDFQTPMRSVQRRLAAD